MKAKDIQLKPPKILLYSPPGAGKTAFAATAGEKAFMLDFDDGLATLRTFRDEFFDARQNVEIMQCLDSNPDRPVAFDKCMSMVLDIQRQAAKNSWAYPVLLLDSLTTCFDSAMRMVLALDGKAGKQPEIQHWGRAAGELGKLFLILRSLPLAVVVTGHEQSKEIEGAESIEVGIPTKALPRQIRILFDETWYLKVRAIGQGKYSREIQTRSSAAINAKSRLNLPDGQDISVGLPAILSKLGYDLTPVKGA